MDSVTIYDAEFLTASGAPQRFWCGPNDPDPLTIQLGAVRLDLNAPFDLSKPEGWYVTPRDRDGNTVLLDPLVTHLTGITDQIIETEGVSLTQALEQLDALSQGGFIVAWGKDELLTIAASLFVQGHPSPIPATRFRSAVPLLVAAGEAVETVQQLRSHTICKHFDLPEQGPAHDARGDALAVASVLQHMLRIERLSAKDFDWA